MRSTNPRQRVRFAYQQVKQLSGEAKNNLQDSYPYLCNLADNQMIIFLKTWYISSTALWPTDYFQHILHKRNVKKPMVYPGFEPSPPRLRVKHRHTKLPGCPVA
jgi:hypothetical protein